MIAAAAPARRNGALREIERRRERLAARLRAAAAIEDAEFEEVPQTRTIPAGESDDGDVA